MERVFSLLPIFTKFGELELKVNWSTWGIFCSACLVSLVSPELRPSLGATECCLMRLLHCEPPCLAIPVLSGRGAKQEGIFPPQVSDDSTDAFVFAVVLGKALLTVDISSSFCLAAVLGCNSVDPSPT